MEIYVKYFFDIDIFSSCFQSRFYHIHWFFSNRSFKQQLMTSRI